MSKKFISEGEPISNFGDATMDYNPHSILKVVSINENEKKILANCVKSKKQVVITCPEEVSGVIPILPESYLLVQQKGWGSRHQITKIKDVSMKETKWKTGYSYEPLFPESVRVAVLAQQMAVSN